MNANEIKNELFKVRGIIRSHEFTVVGDAARCLRGFIPNVDSIEINVYGGNIMNMLSDAGYTIIDEGEFKLCHISDKLVAKFIPDGHPRVMSSLIGMFNCQRFDVVQNPDLPWPYSSFKSMNIGTSMDTPGKYKKTVKGWIEKNTSRNDIKKDINEMMDTAVGHETESIRKWLLDHSDRVRYIWDFSGICFGIQVFERTEDLHITTPMDDYRDGKMFDSKTFKALSLMDQLEWMLKNLEFIPIRCLREDIDPFDTRVSHKWSHIKRNKYVMKQLAHFLDTSKFPPSDNIYYFIKIDRNRNVYLKRDEDMSPKKR